MERFNKKYVLIMLLIGIFLLTGCKANTFDASKIDPGTKVTMVPDDSENITEAITDNNDSHDSVSTNVDDETADVSPTEAAEPLADIELPIYTLNADGNLDQISAFVPEGSELTPELIVDKVVESLADQSIVIGIKSATMEKDAAIVNFMKGEAPDPNMGDEYEANILNALAQSLIDNLDDVKKVIFRIDDNAYSGGAIETDLNEAYMEQ